MYLKSGVLLIIVTGGSIILRKGNNISKKTIGFENSELHE
jgi:hypothetical protein